MFPPPFAASFVVFSFAIQRANTTEVSWSTFVSSIVGSPHGCFVTGKLPKDSKEHAEC